MNFLAHSLFGFNNAALIAGQFCGDFVRGSDLSHLPDGVERGVRFHRFLDRFTDTHQVLEPTRGLIDQVPRRFAGIVVDVMFDHYLANRWTQVCDVSLDEHAKTVISALRSHEAHLPASLNRFTGLLEKENILQNNIHLPAVQYTLSRIAKRSDKFAVLALSQDQLEPLSRRLKQPFDDFYPELNRAALHYIEQHTEIDYDG